MPGRYLERTFFAATVLAFFVSLTESPPKFSATVFLWLLAAFAAGVVAGLFIARRKES